MIIRKILTYHLAALLLVSNVGIPVYTHICHTQEKSWSSIYIPAKSCCSKKKHRSVTVPCHSTVPKDNAEIKSRPCCENREGLLQLSVDFLRCHAGNENAGQILPTMGEYVMGDLFPSVLHYSSFISVKPHGPPLIPYGRSLLISQQVFRC